MDGEREKRHIDGRLVLIAIFAIAIFGGIVFTFLARYAGSQQKKLQEGARAVAAEVETAKDRPTLLALRDRVEKLLQMAKGDASLWLLRAQISWRLDDARSAVYDASMALENDLNIAEAYWLRARAQARLGNNKRALYDVTTALKLGIADTEEARKLKTRLEK